MWLDQCTRKWKRRSHKVHRWDVNSKACSFPWPTIEKKQRWRRYLENLVNLCSNGGHLEIQDGVYFITLWLAPCLTLKHGYRHQNYAPILSRTRDNVENRFWMASILKSKMAAHKCKSQPGKLPIIILEIRRNILIPLASFYPKCLAGPLFWISAPWLIAAFWSWIKHIYTHCSI